MHNRKSVGGKHLKCLSDLIVGNCSWDQSLVRGKKLAFLYLASDTSHGANDQVNLKELIFYLSYLCIHLYTFVFYFI